MMIPTFSGKHIDPLNLSADDIDIVDIAHGLSQTNRWAGQARFPYSVAQHSCLLALAAPEHLANAGLITTPEEQETFAAVCLMHDASEAYIADITRDFKEHLIGYAGFEEEIQKKVFEAFDLPLALMEWVKPFDTAIGVNEEQALFINPRQRSQKPLPNISITQWTPAFAESQFLVLFEKFVETAR